MNRNEVRPLPTGTVTFMFTDLEGSTRLWQEHPRLMPAALARHDAIVRNAIDANGGYVVKTLGDGAHAAFATAADAVTAAIDAQLAIAQEAWDLPEPLRMRVGIHSGPAEVRDGDYYGTAVNRAARIMALAHGGQTLISRATSELVADDGVDIGLRDLGEHHLRGLSRPERVFQVSAPGLPSDFPPLATADAAPVPVRLRPPAFARTDAVLSGRDHALTELDAAWRLARDGTRQVVFLCGEPGIGKTRLAAELAMRADADGAIVLYGRCDEETIVPFQPFVDALRPYLTAVSPEALRNRLRGLTDDLVRLFPELSSDARGPISSAELPAGVGIDDDRTADRYRLFEAVTTLVHSIAVGQPTVLVLDDLHWVDQPTVLLLRHLLRAVSADPLLVVGCYRDVDLLRDQPMAELLADLRREPSVRWLNLVGLDLDASAALLAQRAGRELSAELVETLHHETDGNPFFLEELVRHLADTDAMSLARGTGGDRPLDLPDTIRDTVVRRVRRLPDLVTDVLDAAAVIGAEFDAPLLARVTDRDVPTVLDALDQAALAGLVVNDAAHLGRATFVHALVRQSLYLELVTARRAELHWRVGLALEAQARHAPSAATLAHHFVRAIPVGEAARAIEYSAAAGAAAVSDLAYEDAVAHFERSLDLIDRFPQHEDSLRVDLLIDRADALLYVDERAGVNAALEAVEASRRGGSPVQFGRAIEVFVAPALSAAIHPRETVELFDEALTLLGDDAPALRARLLASMAFKYSTYQLHGRDGRVLADDAVAVATEVGDPLTTADALLARAFGIAGLPDVDARLALGRELVALGRTAGARPWSYGLGVLADAQLAAGDADGLLDSIVQHERLGEELQWLPALVHATRWRATLAMLEGRFDDARKAAQQMRQYAAAGPRGGAAGMRGIILFHLAREQGQVSDPFTAMAVSDHRDNLYALVMVASTQVDHGETSGTLAEVAAAAEGAHQAGQPAWPAFLAVASEAAAVAGDPRHTPFLAQHLVPYRGQLLSMPGGLAALGAADRYLGMLATLTGQWDEAAAYFDGARAVEGRARAHALLPRTRLWEATLLLARGAPDDTDAARAMLDDVVAESARLGMSRLEARAAELASSL